MGAVGALGVASLGLVDLFGAPTGAQSADVVAQLVSVDADGAALPGSNSRPSVSDDGNTIVFTNATPAVGAEPGTFDLVVRRRAAEAGATDALLIPVGSPAPLAAAVSGDGCVVAYSAVAPRPVEEIDVVNDDVVLDGDADGDLADGADDEALVDDPDAGDSAVAGLAGAGLAAAQVAADIIELRSLNLCGAVGIEPVTSVLDRIEADSADLPVPLSAPALSVDGGSIAFATPASVFIYAAGSTPELPDAVTIDAPAGDLLIGDHLDLTADGATVVFEAGPLSADPADAVDAIAPSVYLASVAPAVAADPPVVTVELFAPSDAGSSWPSISADGTLVAYQSDQQLPIEAIPAEGNYVVIAERGAGLTTHRFLTDAAVRPDLAANGTSIGYDVFGSVQVRRSESAVPFQEFSERIVNQRVDVEFVEGAGASVSGVALSGDGTSVVFDQPAGVALSTPALLGAHVWAQATDPLFAPPPTSSTIDNTTTSTIAVTQPTVADTTPNTTRTTTQNTTRTTTSNTTRTTTRSTSSNTVRPTVAPVTPQVAFVPAAFEFAPTIINAGRRTASVELTNPTANSLTVTDVVVEATGTTDFTADSTACTVLAAGATCSVGVVFAPTAAGERTTTVVATLSDGSTAAVALRGVGAPEPVLSVLPGVALNGQVVAVIGSGFPAGATVEFRWNDDVVVSSILIDDRGGFTETRVVLPNTTSGPLEMAVAAQTDLFGEVSTTLLVTDSSGSGNTAVLSGGVTGASLGR